MSKQVAEAVINQKIIFIRGKRVILDFDLANLYEVTTSNLNKAVKRNIRRFPKDFMFRLTSKEYSFLRFQFGILEKGAHSKYLPYAFTEQGVSMLSSVLRSHRAIEVNIAIMRAFVKLRQILSTHKKLERKLNELEKKYDSQFRIVFEAIRQLMKEEEKPKQGIGFHVK